MNNRVFQKILDKHVPRKQTSLERIHSLLAKLGNPQKDLKGVIHIAGTNGKGSTLSFVRAYLEQAGYSVNMYTSPHIHRVNERYYLQGQDVSDDVLEAALAQADQASTDLPCSFFDILTAACFLIFKDHLADYTLLETGLGGRFDATNVIEKPDKIILSAIGLDHTHILGNTLAKIAHEKAGIIKPNCPVYTCLQDPEVLTIFREYADVHVSAPASSFMEENRLLAYSVVRDIPGVKDSNVVSNWPGRMQEISVQGQKITIDCAHNPMGVARCLREYDNPVVLLAVAKDKDLIGMLNAMRGNCREVVAVDIQGTYRDMYSAQEIVKQAARIGLKAKEYSDGDLEKIPHSQPVLAMGSIHLIAKLSRT